jgi:hypothetical protein
VPCPGQPIAELPGRLTRTAHPVLLQTIRPPSAADGGSPPPPAPATGSVVVRVRRGYWDRSRAVRAPRR